MGNVRDVSEKEGDAGVIGVWSTSVSVLGVTGEVLESLLG